MRPLGLAEAGGDQDGTEVPWRATAEPLPAPGKSVPPQLVKGPQCPVTGQMAVSLDSPSVPTPCSSHRSPRTRCWCQTGSVLGRHVIMLTGGLQEDHGESGVHRPQLAPPPLSGTLQCRALSRPQASRHEGMVQGCPHDTGHILAGPASRNCAPSQNLWETKT